MHSMWTFQTVMRIIRKAEPGVPDEETSFGKVI